MNKSMVIQSQLLATKFFMPVASHPLISRPRLTALLDESLKYPLMLISAPAGFGKTMLLSAWGQALPASTSLVAWVSLDEEDNDPQLFWTYVLAALDMDQSQRFTSLLKYLQSPQAPPLKAILTMLINLLLESTQHFVLILDDYHVITEQQVHTTLSYLVEHLSPQFHIILSTRTDPPLSLSLLRSRQRVLEVHTEQLRCTTEETRAFFQKAIGIQLSQETIQDVTTQTEGWLAGLQLLSLSLHGHADPATLLEEASGDQRYILDFLTEEVVGRQPQDVQMFLLSTCILDRLNASLCNAVMEQGGSQQILEHLERANLFVVSLDSKRQWYRYHTLFAQALQYRLEQTYPDQVPILHQRASLWYAQHDQTIQAILHAFSAHQWVWAAELIERKSLQLLSLTWGASEHKLALLRHWLEQLSADVLLSRPRLCLACARILWAVTPYPRLQSWLNAAEATLTASLTTQAHKEVSSMILLPEVLQEQEKLLGEVIAWKAFLRSFEEDGQTALSLCRRALALLPSENVVARVQVGCAQFFAYSSANNVVAAIESGFRSAQLAQTTGQVPLTIGIIALIAQHMLGTGQLHEAQRLSQQAIQMGTLPEGLVLPDVGYASLFQAEILREWNELDTALSLIEEAISLCEQTTSIASLISLLMGHAILLRISLSRRELDAARCALQQVDRISKRMNQPISLYFRSCFTTVDQVRLWLACGELAYATRWAERLDVGECHSTPFACERQEVAYARISLAKGQSDLALERLEPALQRATMGQRWGHVIEIRLLQAIAHQMRQEEIQALDALSKAIRLAEPEGYIRSFVDEGPPMAVLLSRLKEQDCKDGLTPYLDKLLTAFPQRTKARKRQLKQERLR